MRGIFYIKFFFLLLLSTSSHAQQYFFKNYNVENGLPFVQVACMYQDQKGYLWIGGYGGLSRFDGKTFVNFNRRSGLIDHNVNAICQDDTGFIYIGTNKGLSVYDGRFFTNYPNKESRLAYHMTAFCKGFHNKVYIGTTNGLLMYKDKQIKQVDKFKGQKINALLNPDSNVIFIGSDRGLIMYGHGTYKIIDQNNGLCSDKVTALAVFKKQLLVGTDNGLCIVDRATQKITRFGLNNGLIDENIIALYNQNNQSVWIGTNSGLLNFDGKNFSYYNINKDVNSNQIRSVYKDREDNMWFGTNNGLFKYRDQSFTTFDKIAGLGNSFIFQIFRDRNKNLWVCSQNNGIYRESEGFFKRYTRKDGLKSNTSHSGLQDKQGHILFGMMNEVVEFRNEKFHSIVLPKESKGPYEVMYEANDGTIYIGGTSGIVALRWVNGKTQTQFYPIATENDFAVYGFCEDEAQNLYVGTFKNGLLKFSNGQFENLSKTKKLNEENFFTIRYYKGYIIAASLNGLLVYNIKTNELKRINDYDGLNSELIYSIEFTDYKNSLWIGTNQGINKLNLYKYFNENKIEISSFGKQEGFAGVECNSNGIWEDDDGTVWFGTVSGLIKHQPKYFHPNRKQNLTLIQNIKLLNEDTLLPNNAELPSDLNTITFYYRGICFTNPDKVLYQKKLEGLAQDKDWSVPSKEDYIKYTNLAPGKYTFKVRSCNNEGIWDTEDTAFTFTIRSPFYLTWWFIGLVLLFVITGTYAAITYRILKIKKKQKEEFERKVEMSKIELKALRSQMNPHFIFNSLNSIQHYIFNTRSDEAIKYLNKFARLVRVILNNSEKPTVTVGEDLEALKLYLELEQMRFEEKFDFEVKLDESVDPDYDIMPPLLMQPYVENAILHGLNPLPHKGHLSIDLQSKNNFLICTITDNGIGREKSNEIRRTMPQNKHKSLGMKITEDRLKILNDINRSQLSVIITDLKDAQGYATGTQVQLFVPLSI